jgi:hypothetical protein
VKKYAIESDVFADTSVSSHVFIRSCKQRPARKTVRNLQLTQLAQLCPIHHPPAPITKYSPLTHHAPHIYPLYFRLSPPSYSLPSHTHRSQSNNTRTQPSVNILRLTTAPTESHPKNDRLRRLCRL